MPYMTLGAYRSSSLQELLGSARLLRRARRAKLDDGLVRPPRGRSLHAVL